MARGAFISCKWIAEYNKNETLQQIQGLSTVNKSALNPKYAMFYGIVIELIGKFIIIENNTTW